MKSILLSVFSCLFVFNIQAQISSFPYVEDFENGPGLFTSSGTANSWQYGVPINAFINSAASGQRAWVTNLDGEYGLNELSYVQSPYFDFSGLSGVPILVFSHIYDTEEDYDNTWVEYTLNGGSTWTKLGTAGNGSNWYNVAGDDVWNGNSSAWKQASYPLTVLQSEPNVGFRFVMSSDFSLSYEGVGFDDFIIAEAPKDLSISALTAPVSSCNLSTSDTLKVEVTANLGDFYGFTLCYEFDGNTVCESFTDTVNQGNTVEAIFNSSIDLSVSGNYDVNISLNQIPNDIITTNDTLRSKISSIPTINAQDLPYSEDFENGNGFWTASGTRLWEWGVPDTAFINQAANSQRAWVTNLTGSYDPNELSYLSSPCLDFSNVNSTPVLFFSNIFNTEAGFDGSWVDYSTDGGSTWQKLGSFGEGSNWYNSSTDQWWDGNSGAPGEWRNAYIKLDSLEGIAEGKLRFVFSSDGSAQSEGVGVDNIQIVEDPFDFSVRNILSPISLCGLSDTETVQVQVEYSLGEDTLYGISLCYDLDGASFCETFSDTLTPGTITNISFQTKADLSTMGYYDLDIYHTFTNDIIASNDTVSRQIVNKPIIGSLPYLQEFEANGGFFESSGNNSSWAYGEPINIPNSSAGSKVWGTNLSGQYNINEDSYLESNCFDFSGLSEEPYLSFSLNYATENCCDEGWVEYSTDGGSIWNKVLGSPDSENWYNNLGSQWWNGTSGGWVIAKTRLSGVMDSTDVRFRFVFASDGSAQENGFYIDNFLLYTEINDAGVSDAQLPLANCDLPNNYIVNGIFNNYGTDTLFAYDVCYQLNGSASICETVNDTVAPNEIDSFSFTTALDLSANGAYDFLVFSSLSNDFLAGNDTFRISTVNKDDISVFPYQQDFENGPASWSSEGTNSSWALSLPQNSTIQGAASGQNAWVTNPNGNYNDSETSYVYSPCFDFTAQQPGLWVGLNIWWHTEELWDGAVLQYSIDSQSTWNTIGDLGDPFNWYNSNSFNLNPGGSSNAWAGLNASGSGSYVWAQNPLDTAISGEGNVVFRIAFDSDGSNNYNGIAFDDFTIGEIPSPQILSDTVVCSGATIGTNLPSLKHRWSNGDTTAQTVLLNTSSVPVDVELVVEVKNSFGFIQYDTLNIDVNPGPYFELGNDATLCYNTCVEIGAELDDYIYSWNTGANSDSLNVCNSSSFETFILSAFDSSNTCSYIDTINLNFTAPVDLGNDTAFCTGESLDFAINSSIWDSAVWSNGSAGFTSNVSSGGQLSVIAIDNFACISTDTIDITENAAPQIDLGADTVLCDTSSIILGVIAGNYDYEWTLDGSTVVGNTQSINVSSSGIYDITLTTPEGCVSSDAKVVTFENCTGIEAFLEENELEIYPNPSNGQFFLSIAGAATGNIQLQILDLSGKEVLNINDEKSDHIYKREFDLENLTKGIYFMNIKHKDVVLNEKLVVQ